MTKQIDEYARPQAPHPMWAVSLLPAGVSPFTAQPGQLHQLVVSAPNALDAQFDANVQAHIKVGWVVAEVVPSDRHSLLAHDVHARAQRAAEDAIDPVPADLRSPNNRPPIGVPRFETMPASLPPALSSYRRG